MVLVEIDRQQDGVDRKIHRRRRDDQERADKGENTEYGPCVMMPATLFRQAQQIQVACCPLVVIRLNARIHGVQSGGDGSAGAQEEAQRQCQSSGFEWFHKVSVDFLWGRSSPGVSSVRGGSDAAVVAVPPQIQRG